MPTNVRTDGKDLISQHSKGFVFQPADPVLLLPKGDPGVAPHFNISTKINNPAGTVYDHGTAVAHRQSFLGSGKHAPVVMIGKNVPTKDGDNSFLSWAKSLYVESRQAVMHAVKTGVNTLWTMLPAAAQTALNNAGQITGGMSAQDFKDAAMDDAQAMLDELLSTDTLISLGESLALTALAGVPVVGQIAGGAAVVQRMNSVLQATAGAGQELAAMAERWSKPMTPEQIKAERKKLASFLIRVGIAAILAALGKALKKRSKGAQDNGPNSNKDAQVGQGPKAQATGCACAIGKPVIIATGEKMLADTDFSLPGMIDLSWRRHYRSGNTRMSWFGQGWSHPLAQMLQLGAQGILLHDANGRSVNLPMIAVGAEHFDAYEGFTLYHPEAHAWHIIGKDGLCRTWRRARADCWLLPLAAITNRNGQRISLHYGDAPADSFAPYRPHALSDSAGRILSLQWNAGGQLLQVGLQAHGGVWPLARYAYDEQGCLLQAESGREEDGSHAIRHYHWRQGMLIGYTRADGSRFAAEYDQLSPQGRVLRSWHVESGAGLRFSYDPQRRCNTVTDALGRSTRYEYDEREDIIATTGPDGVRLATPFDPSGRPSQESDALGRSTHFQFDARGNLTAITDPAGAKTTIAYNVLDLPIKLTDALQQVTQQEYDARGNLLTRIDAAGQQTRFRYDERGLLREIEDARGGLKRLQWDGHANLQEYRDCSQRSTRMTYDALGRLLTQSDALGQTTRYVWDANSRLRQVQEADGSVQHYAWDAEGRLVRHTDALGHSTCYAYDGLGRLLQKTDANGHSLRYAYDAVGRLITLTNENREETHFRYDLQDNLIEEIGFDGRLQRYHYNAAGELTHLLEVGGSDYGPGKVTRFTRDALGRLLEKVCDAAPHEITRYRYDKLGQLLGADNAHAKLSFAYTALGQLREEIQHLHGGAPLKLAHEYDVLGNRSLTKLPDGRIINRLFYGSGHLHQINLMQPDGAMQIIADIERDALHREIQRSQGALHSAYDYDPMGRLLRQRAQQTLANRELSVAIARDYRYDAAGNLLQKHANIGATPHFNGRQETQHYVYDPAGRILQAQHQRGASQIQERFIYDPAGNLDEFSFGLPGNRLTRWRDLEYRYDSHGNVRQRTRGADERAEFAWDSSHQLRKATVTRQGVTQETEYEYDALGRRTRKRDAFGVTEYLWDGDLLLHSQRGAKQALYFYEADSFVPLATQQDGAMYWYHCDQIGTPQELTDAQGRVVWAAQYKVWGEAEMLQTGTGSAWQYGEPLPQVEQPFRFQGQQYDAETGLHYNRFRYYDPAIGRFISQDPIGLLGGSNLFAYADNPIDWIDPLGLAKKHCGKVYRALTPQQTSSALKGEALQPKNIHASYTPQEHVEDGKRRTQYNSTSKMKDRAEFYAGDKGTMVEIDLSLIPDCNIEDVSDGADFSGKAYRYARKDKEVLIKGSIPKGSYKILPKK
ncbi:RHS repeat-associated core domain-containing protein [Massilia sp. W12]|uniref:RHS repeat-associated core domain-containing protein n=1 Tax=Massilia sp. W12 TaxID=3126507 RepID=UPI0030CB9B88